MRDWGIMAQKRIGQLSDTAIFASFFLNYKYFRIQIKKGGSGEAQKTKAQN